MFMRKPAFVKLLTGAAVLVALSAALFLVAGSGSTAQGQALGDAAKGKKAWNSLPLSFVCQSCHGSNGEGAFGPDLAGRTLTVAQWTRQVRKPYGLMPAFATSAISDETIADVAAYMASLPTVPSPGTPRAVTSPGDPVGKQLVIDKGCAQCHRGARDLRAGIGENGLTRADVISQIRTAFFAAKFAGRGAWMPTFAENQVGADDAAKIADYIFAAGPRVRLDVSTKATQAGNVVTYAITVTSRSLAGGMDAGQVFVAGSVPRGATFLGATATPANSFFRGFEAAETPLQAAVWLTERIPPATTSTYSYQVQVGPGVPAAAHAFVHWLGPSEETVITPDVSP